MVIRKFNSLENEWSLVPAGLSGVLVAEFVWPDQARNPDDLGLVEANVRTSGGINTCNLKGVMVPVQGLVFPVDWVLATNNESNSPTTIRGSPVPTGFGSPLGIAMKTGTQLLMVGSSLELQLEHSERYQRGKGVVTVLVVGYFMVRKASARDSALYHESESMRFQ